MFVVVVEVNVDVDETELLDKVVKDSVASIEELDQQAADVVTQRVVVAKTVVNSVTVTFTMVVTL